MADIALDEIPATYWDDVNQKPIQFSISCQGCQDVTQVPASFLGRKVRCKKCDTRFVAEWGEPTNCD